MYSSNSARHWKAKWIGFATILWSTPPPMHSAAWVPCWCCSAVLLLCAKSGHQPLCQRSSSTAHTGPLRRLAHQKGPQLSTDSGWDDVVQLNTVPRHYSCNMVPFRINATGVLAALPFTVPPFCTTCEGARGLLNALCSRVCPEPRPVILNHPISPPCHVMLHSLQKSLEKVRAKFIHLRKFPDH